MDEFLNTDLRAIQNRNEKTPSKPNSFAIVSREPNDKPSSARCLFPSPSATPTRSTATGSPNSNTKSPKKPSYALGEIYKRFYDCEPENAHNAEVDALLILKCAITIKHDFIHKADSLAIKFGDAQFK